MSQEWMVGYTATPRDLATDAGRAAATSSVSLVKPREQRETLAGWLSLQRHSSSIGERCYSQDTMQGLCLRRLRGLLNGGNPRWPPVPVDNPQHTIKHDRLPSVSVATLIDGLFECSPVIASQAPRRINPHHVKPGASADALRAFSS